MNNVHRILPSFMPMVGITLFQHIFVQKNVGDDVIAHEEIHVGQQRRDGLKFYFRYLFSAKWRVRYEAEAYVVNFENGWSLDDLAETLSGWLYLKPCSFTAARAAIVEAVREQSCA